MLPLTACNEPESDMIKDLARNLFEMLVRPFWAYEVSRRRCNQLIKRMAHKRLLADRAGIREYRWYRDIWDRGRCWRD